MSFQDLSGRSANHLPTVLLSNRYRVLSVLGDGGFGKTFLVEDTHMPSNKKCVLKQLKPVRDRPEVAQLVRDRFEREAATLEMLGEAHDQIPRLYAHFEEEGEFYLVEEWIDGITLTQKVQREGVQSEASAQQVIANLLPAIAHIHAQKMVHRDIKPDNIILRIRDGKPVLIDFGAVKETMKTVMSSVERSTQSIVVGTPGYMPSEQISGRPVYASDIYSLGVSAIYMLTGRHPQDFQSDPQTGDWNWRDYAPNTSDGFAQFLNRAIQYSPRDRFSTSEEMQTALKRLANGEASLSSFNRISATVPETIASSPPTSARQTKVVSPANSANFTAQPAKRSFNGSVIIGGLVGLGVLISGLWLQNKFSEIFSNEPELSEVLTESSVEPVEESMVIKTQTSEISADQVAETDDTQGVSQPVSITEATASTSALPPEELPDNAVPNSNATVIGSERFYYIRKKPNSNALTGGNVDVKSRIRVLGYAVGSEGYGWYQLLAPSGAQGWVPEQVVWLDSDNRIDASELPDPGSVPLPNAKVIGNSRFHYLREKPSSEASTSGNVDVKSRIRVIGSDTDSEGYPWYRVLTPSGRAGWIPEQVVQLDAGATPSIPAPPGSVPQRSVQ